MEDIVADDDDVMRDQLEYLIRCAKVQDQDVDAERRRYLRVREILLEAFAEQCPRLPLASVGGELLHQAGA